MSEQTNTRKVKRVRREQVIIVTIPTITLTIDAKIEDGKLTIGVAGSLPINVSDPIDAIPAQDT